MKHVKPKSKSQDPEPKATAPCGAAGQFLTVRQLAARWQISARHVHRIIERGELRVHNFGRSIRIARNDIELFELRHRSQGLSARGSS